jgi:uncharacterized protein (DUF697 family)
VGGAAFAAIPIAGTSTGLATLETHMMAVIGEIYGESVGAVASTAVGGSFTILGQGLKWGVHRALALVPGPAGFAVRIITAGVIVELLGRTITEHFERKYPGKVFRKA